MGKVVLEGLNVSDGSMKKPFGVSPFRNGSMKPISRSAWLMTAVCEVAGRTARREAGSGLPMSPMTPPPSSRNIATECSSVATSASPVMISTGVFSAFTSASQAIGSFSSCDQLLDQRREAVGIGGELL